jgi:hypothetical protein
MPVKRVPGGTSLIDVLDRVLDKGIVIDAWVRMSLVGVDLISFEARMVVASIDTYVQHAEPVRLVPPISRPPILAADRLAADRLAADRLAADRLAADRTAAERKKQEVTVRAPQNGHGRRKKRP